MSSIYLDPIKHEALVRLSKASGRPVAEHMREAVDDLLAKHSVPLPKLQIPRAKK